MFSPLDSFAVSSISSPKNWMTAASLALQARNISIMPVKIESIGLSREMKSFKNSCKDTRNASKAHQSQQEREQEALLASRVASSWKTSIPKQSRVHFDWRDLAREPVLRRNSFPVALKPDMGRAGVNTNVALYIIHSKREIQPTSSLCFPPQPSKDLGGNLPSAA
jgi:hypothetical protein